MKAEGPGFRPMCATAVSTGMRQGERLGLDWDNIGFDNNVIKVRRSFTGSLETYHAVRGGETRYVVVPPKSKASIRDIDMSPEPCKKLLELYMKSGKTGLVFCITKGTAMNPANIAGYTAATTTGGPLLFAYSCLRTSR